MPILNTPEELLNALGSSAFAADPLADLKKRGYTLSDALTRQWQAAIARQKPQSAPLLSSKGARTFQAVPLSLVAPLPPANPNGYDAVAGVRLPLANEIISALYDSGTIPHQIALDKQLSASDLAFLAGAFTVDRTGGHLSRLHITSAPTLASIADGSSVIALQVPIQLDWIRTELTINGPTQQFVTDAVGNLQLTMSLVANVLAGPQMDAPSVTISIQLDTEATIADSPRLTINPGSPVKLTNAVAANQIDRFAVIIQNALEQQFHNNLSFTVTPPLTLPLEYLDVRHADVVTNGGSLIAGLQFVGTLATAVPALLTGLFPDDAANIFVQVQETVFDLAVQKAFANGVSGSSAVVDSVSTAFQNNSLVIQVKAHLPDECIIADLHFIYTRTISVKLLNGTIEVDQSDDISVGEASNLWCLLTFGIGAALVLGDGILLALAAGGLGYVLLEGVAGPDIPPIIANLDTAIPGTDKLATLVDTTSPGYFQITPSALFLAAVAGLEPDTVNTVIYVRFLGKNPSSAEISSTEPLAGATVHLMDQDAPAPAGDDAPTTQPANTSEGIGKHNVVNVYTFHPPTADQQLAQGTTNLDGVVRFALSTGDLITTAGTITVATTKYDADAQRNLTTITSTDVIEQSPDLYFRVTTPDGSVIDSRGFAGGFMLNFQSSRIGTLANPLTITLAPTQTIVAHAAT